MNELIIAEYQQLKEEQRSRIAARDSLLNYHVVAMGALVALGASTSNLESVALTMPWIAVVFGWTYLSHDDKITALGAHIRRTAPQGAFAWESQSKRLAIPDALARAITFSVLILAFTVPAIAGPLWWLLHRASAQEGWLILLSGVEIVLGLLTALLALRTTRLWS